MKKPVIVFSSHVARGSVGNRAAVFALEVLGHPIWAIPTIILPFHPGHRKATRIVPDTKQFENLLDDLLLSPWINEVAAVLTGYMANAEQARITGAFISNLKEKNPDTCYICDPVMGDGIMGENGNLYIAEETAHSLKDYLVNQADIITPNRFELSWLTGKIVTDPASAALAANTYNNKQILVTSMPGFMRGNIGNLLISGKNHIFAEHRQLDNPPNGPGDLTAALYLSHYLSKSAPEKALQKTTASVFEIVSGAAKRGADELMLESDAKAITNPVAMVQMRNLNQPIKTTKKAKTVFKPTPL